MFKVQSGMRNKVQGSAVSITNSGNGRVIGKHCSPSPPSRRTHPSPCPLAVRGEGVTVLHSPRCDELACVTYSLPVRRESMTVHHSRTRDELACVRYSLPVRRMTVHHSRTCDELACAKYPLPVRREGITFHHS